MKEQAVKRAQRYIRNLAGGNTPLATMLECESISIIKELISLLPKEDN